MVCFSNFGRKTEHQLDLSVLQILQVLCNNKVDLLIWQWLFLGLTDVLSIYLCKLIHFRIIPNHQQYKFIVLICFHLHFLSITSAIAKITEIGFVNTDNSRSLPPYWNFVAKQLYFSSLFVIKIKNHI